MGFSVRYPWGFFLLSLYHIAISENHGGCVRMIESLGLSGHVLGPRSGGTTGAALGQALGLSSMASATGPQARLRAQAITNLGPIYWNGPCWLFGILGDLHCAFASSQFSTPDARVEQAICLSSTTLLVCPALPQKLLSFLVRFWSE